MKHQISTGDGKTLTFYGDMVWIETGMSSVEELNELSYMLRFFLATLTIQIRHPLDFELIAWMEDKPRQGPDDRDYTLGRVNPNPDPPQVTADVLNRAAPFSHIANYSPHYMHAILDYLSALSYPHEAIVFCARAVEWVSKYFNGRQHMQKCLNLPKKYVTRFHKLANETVIARHAGKPGQIRHPMGNEIEFSLRFTQGAILDRFGDYLLYELARDHTSGLYWPGEPLEPSELFEADNVNLAALLEKALQMEGSGTGLWYIPEPELNSS